MGVDRIRRWAGSWDRVVGAGIVDETLFGLGLGLDFELLALDLARTLACGGGTGCAFLLGAQTSGWFSLRSSPTARAAPFGGASGERCCCCCCSVRSSSLVRAFRCAISRPSFLAPAGCLAEAGAGTGDRGSGTGAAGDVLTGFPVAAEGKEDGPGTSALERVTRVEGGAAGGGRPGAAGAGADGWVRLRKRLGDMGRITSSSSVAMLVGRHSGGGVVLLALLLLFMRGDVGETGAQLLA